MSESKSIPHEKLHQMESAIGVHRGSKVYHLEDLSRLDSRHDGRKKKVIINEKMVETQILVDVLTYEPDATSPLHYHKGTEHFFFVLGGRGHIEIEGTAYELKEGTVVWVAEGDRHKLYSKPDSELRLLEFFSSGKHETRFLEQGCQWELQP